MINRFTKVLILVAVLFPSLALAQVFGQNQIIPNTAYGSATTPAFLISNSSVASAKLTSTTTPFFANFSFGNASGTLLALPGITSKILKTNSLGQIVAATAGTDYQVAGSYLTAAITALGPLNQTQTGTTQTLATSSATTISGLTVGLKIVGNSNTQTFTPTFTGSISGLTTTNFASANVSQFTNDSGYRTGSGTSGNCVQWGASNALADAGAPCGSGSGGAAYPFTPSTFGIAVSATTTPILDYAGLITATSTIGSLTASSSITNQSVKSALVLNGSTGLEGAYAGSANPCSANQAPTTLSAGGALGGCTSTFLTGNQTITLSGVVTGSGATSITTAFGSQSAGVLGNPATGNTAVQATSTLYGAVQNGKVLAGLNGILAYVSTTTDSCSTGVTCTYSGGVNSFSIAAGAITNSMLASTYMTSVGVASANGFTGSSSGGATPNITIATSITGLLKGNGTAISAATNGTDFSLITANTCTGVQFFNAVTAAGVFTCGTPSGGGGSVGNWFTPTTNFGINTNATSTAISFFQGIFASSTSVIASTTFAINGNVGVGTSSPVATLTVASKTSADATPAFVIDGALGGFNADMQLNRGSNTGTEEANIDFATAGTVNWQEGIQNNNTSDFELWDGSNDPVFTIKSSSNATGFGTSTPFGDFAIDADYGDSTAVPIFNVASSSATATTSLFSINSPTASSDILDVDSLAGTQFLTVSSIGSTTLGLFGTCNTTSALTTNSSGAISCGAITGSGSSFAYPFTPSTDNSIVTSATSTALEDTHPGLGMDVAATSWYGIAGQLLAYASSTNQDTIFGLSAGGQNATTSATVGDNTAVGYQALIKNTSATGNTAIGAKALSNTSSGGLNTAVGYQAGINITSGNSNTAIGEAALGLIQSTSDNTAVGLSSLSVATGAGNTALGYQTGNQSITGNANIIIGMAINIPSLTTNGQLNIGNVLYGNNMHNSTTASFAPQANPLIGVGSTSPFANFSIQANNGDTTRMLFAIGSSTASATTTIFGIDNVGHQRFGGPLPTCGTGCSSIAGNDDGGAITTSASATAVTLNFANAWSATPICTVSDNSTAVTGDISSLSTTAFTISFSLGLTGTIYYQCSLYTN